MGTVSHWTSHALHQPWFRDPRNSGPVELPSGDHAANPAPRCWIGHGCETACTKKNLLGEIVYVSCCWLKTYYRLSMATNLRPQPGWSPSSSGSRIHASLCCLRGFALGDAAGDSCGRYFPAARAHARRTRTSGVPQPGSHRAVCRRASRQFAAGMRRCSTAATSDHTGSAVHTLRPSQEGQGELHYRN